MKRRLFGAALLLGIMLPAGAALAQAPVYSFETPLAAGPDGFFGLGATVTQEPTIGVTHLENSLKYEVGVGGFVGARTETLVPPTLNDPPGVQYVLFDLTIVDPYPDTFADIGVTLFGHALNAPGGAQFGHQVQFADQLPMAGLTAGTHLDQRIDLDLSVGPYRPGDSFNEIFGPGPNDLTVSSAFQFFINKNVLTPITIYIDNVRLVVPEPASIGLAGLGGLATLRLLRRRQRAA
jgi:hypothetical protein